MNNSNQNQEKKILIIEDDAPDYRAMKKWLNSIGYGVIPEKFNDMAKASKTQSRIFDFVDDIIKKNYIDLKLILCDIDLGNDYERGNQIVHHIREFKKLNPSYWTSLIPIIGITKHADKEYLINETSKNGLKTKTSKKGIVNEGADFAFNKQDVFKIKDRKIIIKTDRRIQEIRNQIDSRVIRFEDQINDLYPKDLDKKIKRFIKKQNNKLSAFIMIDFRHKEKYAVKVVKKVLEEDLGINAHIADAPGGQNDSRVWENIEIFMHGCDFGIAIYVDDTEPDKDGKKRDNKMNPNVSVEVGYMRGLKKSVLFFKHKSIPSLPSDFKRENYAEFNSARSLKTQLITVVNNWIENTYNTM